jgi:KDO2-lipid IV(A) lauroyltransferase
MTRAGIEPRVAPEMFASLGTSAIELLWIAARPRSLAEYTEIEPNSSQEILRARREGRGIVFAASHTGNWDLAACAIAREVPLMVVTKRLSASWVDAFWQSSRAAYGVTLVEAAGAMRKARTHLANGGAVAMMIDQVPDDTKHAIQAPFLGANAWVDRAPFALAARTGAPLMVSAAHRRARTQSLEVIDVLRPPERGRSEWIAEAATRATASLDAFVRAHPTEWLWMHRRWKPAPLAASAEPR